MSAAEVQDLGDASAKPGGEDSEDGSEKNATADGVDAVTNDDTVS